MIVGHVFGFVLLLWACILGSHCCSCLWSSGDVPGRFVLLCIKELRQFIQGCQTRSFGIWKTRSILCQLPSFLRFWCEGIGSGEQAVAFLWTLGIQHRLLYIIINRYYNISRSSMITCTQYDTHPWWSYVWCCRRLWKVDPTNLLFYAPSSEEERPHHQSWGTR